MKVFVSGQIDEKEKIRNVYARLRQEGFEVTHDWTETDDLAAEGKFSAEAGFRASKDIIGINVYALLTIINI